MRRKTKYFVRRARAGSASVDTRGLMQLFRNMVISVAVIMIFLFSANIVMKYVAEKMDIKKISLPSFFTKPVFFIVGENFYTVFSNGKVEMIKENIDRSSLPILSGIKIKEERAEHKRVLKSVLKINTKYFVDISEINLRNPAKIVMISVDGKKIYVGSVLNEEKMKNYTLVRKDPRLKGKRYSYIDMRFKDRVIIK